MRAYSFILFIFLAIAAQAQYLGQAFSPEEYYLTKDHPNESKWTDPQKAAIWSAVLPGAGQIYNKRYWKAGLVYGGAFGLIYMYKTNLDSMRAYQTAYNRRIDGDSNTIDTRYSLLTDAAVRGNRDYHRRLRDISILGFVGLYALQIIDANVDAHLKEFRVNDELSMTVRPYFQPSMNTVQSQTGLSLNLRF